MTGEEENSSLKKLRSNYRLVIMNEDTFEEVIKFKLTRTSVYVMLSSIFILMIALTAALIVFTPLKYYLPNSGYGDAKQVMEYRQLKIRTDSMELALKQQNNYMMNIKNVLQGKITQLDTTKIKITQ
jgi:hypothetical protein